MAAAVAVSVAVAFAFALMVAVAVAVVVAASGPVAVEHADSIPVVVASSSAFAHATGWFSVTTASIAVPVQAASHVSAARSTNGRRLRPSSFWW